MSYHIDPSISFLSNFSKIFERLFFLRLKFVLEQHNIIPDQQFGFRSKHGTPEQFHRIINVLTNAFKTKNIALLYS